MSELDAFSADWARILAARLEADATYLQAAARWDDPLVLGLRGADAVFLDLRHGRCLDARPATARDRESATFVIEAEADTWRRVLAGDIDPIFGLMSGKLKLERGKVAALLPHTAAAKALVTVAATIETRFPENHRP